MALQTATQEDPLTRALRPLPEETPDQRTARLEAEALAKTISTEIDEYLRKEAQKRKEQKVKLLLLGQAESGKSTVLKNMKLVYAAEDFQRERASWPPIIHYNILRQVVRIVTLLEEAIHEQNGQQTTRPSMSSEASTTVTGTGRRQSLDNRFTTEHQGLCLRLKPLMDVEATMTKHLLQSIHRRDGEEVCVHSYFSWRKYFHPSQDPEYNARNSRTVGDSLKTEVSTVLNNSRGYVLRLWNDPCVRRLLHSQAIQLEHEAGFFLDDLERVTALEYEPTDLDVCKARLRTVGVSETHLKVRTGFSHSDWVVYDVGGSRTQRASWKSFFDDVNAIVFLAPLSAFNQKLEENPRVNRLEDSLLMWRDISSSPLLSRAHLILFLNKIDLLRKKLEQGIEFNAFLTGYTGSNESDAVVKHMKKKFLAVYKDAQEKLKDEDKATNRTVYVYPTSALDLRATRGIICEVQTSILSQHLKTSAMV